MPPRSMSFGGWPWTIGRCWPTSRSGAGSERATSSMPRATRLSTFTSWNRAASVCSTRRPRARATVTYRGPGDLFGISPLAENGRRVTSAQALEPSAIWAIASQDVDEVTRRLPTLASGMIKSLSLRLRDLMVLVESVATLPARLRVANFLLANRDRQRGASAAVSEGWTHESIADRLGCTRQTVTEALNEFARKGWIRIERKRVVGHRSPCS